jgi:hypothetical protein
MKRILYHLTLLLTITAVSCEKKVIDIEPSDRISSGLAFSTPQKMENSVLGAYNMLQDANYLSGRALIYVDIMGEDIFDKGSFFGDLPRFNMLANSTFASGAWNAGYRSIVTANRAIAGIAANPGIVTVAKAKELTAECLFVRAVSNFYMVNFFAQPYVFTADASHPGIPLITESFTSNDPAANKPKSSVAAVYNAIIADLTAALADLPASYGTTYATRTRATKAAAAALLARVHLYKADYANAKTMSQNIINGQYGTYALRPTPGGAFGPGNYQTSETIWSIPNNATDNPNTNNALPQHYAAGGRGDLAVSASFRNTTTNPYFASDDLRRGLLVAGTGANASYIFTSKYPDVTNRADWSPILRFAEVLLTYAEASARVGAGIDADAIAKLNMVRDRARVSAPQYTLLSFISKDDLINAVLGERRIELAFEGHRFWDLMRLKKNVTNKYDADGVSLLPTQSFGANKSIFPIPQIEVDKSVGTLVQNSGY